MRLPLLAIASSFSIISAVAPLEAAVDPSRAITVSRTVHAPVQDVYESWTTSEGFKRVVGASAKIELRTGGPFEIYWSDEAPAGERGSEGCTVLSFIPNQMFSFTWNAPPKFENVRKQHTAVVVTFEPVGDSTLVTLVQNGWPCEGESAEWDEVFSYFSNAWPWVLDQFVQHFESVNGPTPDVRSGWMYMFVGPVRSDLFDGMTAEEQAKFAEHFKYLKDRTESGQVVFAGPCMDESRIGIVIFHAESEAAARTLMENDPVVKHKILKAELHPLRFSLVRDMQR